MLESVTLDQLRVLAAVVDAGGFTAASRRVQRTQSAVSHAIAQLELHLDVQLFDRAGRKPVLTPAGEAVLADARSVLARADRLRARARGMAAGLESDVTLAISVVTPRAPLAVGLRALRDAYPSVTVRASVEEIGGAAQTVAAGGAMLGVVGKPSLEAELAQTLETTPLGAVSIVAVAAPDHPLAQAQGALTSADVADHRQIAPSARAASLFPLRMVSDVWEVAELGLRLAMLREGLGWGVLPRHAAQDDLDAGRLVALPFDAADGRFRVPLFAVHRTDAELGPARRLLLQAWRKSFAA